MARILPAVSGLATNWKTPARWPNLAGDEIHVWLASLEGWRAAIHDCCAVLRDDETARAARFRDGDPRVRYQVTRGVLRCLLGRYCGIAPRDIKFCYNPHGKPELLDGKLGLHFNVSHSGDVAAFAFTRAGAVGVDVERVRQDMPRQSEIAERHFAPGEFQALREVPVAERSHAFFRCWARKEAVLKARGDGIFGGLQNFEVNVDSTPARVIRATGRARYLLADLPPIPDFTGAVALAAADAATAAPVLQCWCAAPASLLP